MFLGETEAEAADFEVVVQTYEDCLDHVLDFAEALVFGDLLGLAGVFLLLHVFFQNVQTSAEEVFYVDGLEIVWG